MNHQLYTLLLCAMTLLVSSCRSSPNYPREIIGAERCMDTHPDSVLTMLRSLQSTIHLEPEETQVYYHLLTLEARKRCELPCTSDSTIMRITDYYRKRNNWEQLTDTYYMKATWLYPIVIFTFAISTTGAVYVLRKRKGREDRETKEDILRKSSIYIRFHSLNSNSITEQDWKELQIAIDNAYDNFTGKLYALHPKLSTIELHICYLIKISISITHISLLLGRSKSAISAARGKLYEKLQRTKGTPDMLDELIAAL